MPGAGNPARPSDIASEFTELRAFLSLLMFSELRRQDPENAKILTTQEPDKISPTHTQTTEEME